jgi:hypothetical protein
MTSRPGAPTVPIPNSEVAMKIEKDRERPKLTRGRLQKFESDTGLTLPADYRAFLLKHNGGSPVDSRFEVPDIREDVLLDYFYSIDGRSGVDLEKELATWESEMPEGFLPIGRDPGGAIIIMGTAGEYAGRVFFWDHQHRSLHSSHEENTFPVAASFTEFTESLKADDGPSRWDAEAPDIAELIELTLAHSGGLQPIQTARLATEFGKATDPQKAISEILKKLFDHKSFHVRRVAVRACGRIKAFDAPGLEGALVKKLSDPEGWVRYDAVWVIREAGYDSPKLRKALAKLAKGVTLPQDEKNAEERSSDSDLRARVDARKLLDALTAKS